ncbi:MAG: glycosyltransferase, partial [Acidimicrobiales bacterium]
MRPTPRWIGRKLLGAARFPDRAMARLDHNETRVTELDDRLREAAAQTAAHAAALEDLRTTVERLLAAQDSSRLSQEAAQRQLNARAATDLARLALRLADVDPPRPAPGPLVSIVVATWNRADCIAGALDSVVHQTYPAWECLVVDDGSDDDTEAVVRGYLVDPRFTFEQLPHGGAPAARNRGLELASGDLVSYLDSDNRWHPTHLARAVDALVGAPESAWALSGQVIVDEVTGDASLRDDLRSPSTIDGNFADLNAITHRRAVIERIGAFDAALTRLSDWDLAIRLASMSPPLRVRAAT